MEVDELTGVTDMDDQTDAKELPCNIDNECNQNSSLLQYDDSTTPASNCLQATHPPSDVTPWDEEKVVIENLDLPTAKRDMTPVRVRAVFNQFLEDRPSRFIYYTGRRNRWVCHGSVYRQHQDGRYASQDHQQVLNYNIGNGSFLLAL